MKLTFTQFFHFVTFLNKNDQRKQRKEISEIEPHQLIRGAGRDPPPLVLSAKTLFICVGFSHVIIKLKPLKTSSTMPNRTKTRT